MEKNYKFSVPNVTGKVRLDKYITQFVENASRTKVKKAIDLGNVLVNGDFVKCNYIVKPEDEIEIELPVPEKQEIEPEDIPLDIVFEDEYLMIINKPAGMVVHPAYMNFTGTLVNAILFYAAQKNESLSDINGFERAGIVHRLDKDTSGLIVVAKDEVAHRKLSNLFFHHNIIREYNAICWGRFKVSKKEIDTKIGRDKKDRTKYIVVSDGEDGKRAITEYEVIKEFEYMSLVKLKLKTGRTHQIRVHMSYLNHPVFGDLTYGGRVPHNLQLTSNLKAQINNLLDIMPRQALHAKVLGFKHPMTNEQMYFESDLPADMQEVIKKIS